VIVLLWQECYAKDSVPPEQPLAYQCKDAHSLLAVEQASVRCRSNLQSPS